MDQMEPESFGLFCPDAADVFIRREAFEGLEAAGEIVCRDEIADLSAESIVAIVDRLTVASLIVRFLRST